MTRQEVFNWCIQHNTVQDRSNQGMTGMLFCAAQTIKSGMDDGSQQR